MVGYKGVIKMAQNTGFILDVDVKAVFEKDHFSYGYGLNPFLDHQPFRDGDRGIFVAAYAVLTLSSGLKKFEVLELSDAAKHRERFALAKDKKGSVFGPWLDDFPSMCMKTVAIKACKYCAASPERVPAGRERDAQVFTKMVHTEELKDATDRTLQEPIAEPAEVTVNEERPSSQDPATEVRNPETKEPDQTTEIKYITPEDRRDLWDTAKALGINSATYTAILEDMGYESSTHIPAADLSKVQDRIEEAASAHVQ